MSDEPSNATVSVADLRALIASVEQDVVGQCWTLFQGLLDLVVAAEQPAS